MKKVVMLLAMALMTGSAFAQSKGVTELTVGGPLYQNRSEAKVSTIGPAVGVGYFIMDNIEVGGELALRKLSGDGAGNTDFSAAVDVNGKYHFMVKDKMWPYVGAHVNFGLGDGPLGKAGGSDAPLTFGAAVGAKYWPMEGGAVYGEVAFDKTSPSAIKETTIGVNLGILIRLK